jgi:hypothetical protein
LLKAAVALVLYEDVEVAVIAIGSCGVAGPRSHKSGKHLLTPNAAETGTTAMAEAMVMAMTFFGNLCIRILLSQCEAIRGRILAQRRSRMNGRREHGETARPNPG